MKFVAVLSAFLLTFAVKAGGIDFQDLSLKEALLKARKENKALFIDVYATWCGPCKYLSRNVFTENDLGDYMNAHFINLKIDGEKGDGVQLMEQFGIDAFPTMLFLSPDEELLKKIVGAVDKDEILKQATYIAEPESSPLFASNKKFADGERSKAFLLEHISALFDADEGTGEAVEEYLKLYPQLDLDESDEFLVFCLGVEDLDDPHISEFLGNIEHYNELYEDFTFAKMKVLLVDLARRAGEAGDEGIISDGLDKLYGPFQKILDEPISREELSDALVEIMEE